MNRRWLSHYKSSRLHRDGGTGFSARFAHKITPVDVANDAIQDAIIRENDDDTVTHALNNSKIRISHHGSVVFQF